MSNMSDDAKHQEMINASRAMGAIIEVEPNEFLNIISRGDAPLVVWSAGGIFTNYSYLTNYKGLCFYTDSATLLPLPTNAEIIKSEYIWIPR